MTTFFKPCAWLVDSRRMAGDNRSQAPRVLEIPYAALMKFRLFFCLLPLCLWAQENKPTDAPLIPSTKRLSLTATVALPAGAKGVLWEARGKDGQGESPLKIEAKDGAVMVSVKTAASKPPMILKIPGAALADGKKHALALRHSGPNLELFLDGVLVDEDWPVGNVPAFEASQAGRGGLSDVTAYDVALTDARIESLAGSPESLAARQSRILGVQAPVDAFWKPRGRDTWVGDCMPFFHEGIFHVYYLADRRNHRSKWGLGAHQWAHLSTRDFKTWREHPMALGITDESEGSICTGSVFFHDGIFYAFYAVRKAFDTPLPRLGMATSPDGERFLQKTPLVPLSSPYRDRTTRDPFVFQDPATGLFHMLVTTSLTDGPLANRDGCLAHLTSPDLKTWSQQPPFIVPGYPAEPECPDLFEWNGWYYLLFSNNAQTRYRMARGIDGPWERPAVDSLDDARLCVMKTAPFTGNRRIGAAFLSSGRYGGYLVLRELVQNPDGSLGTKWVPEAVPAGKAPLALKCEPLTQGVTCDNRAAQFAGAAGLSAVSLGGAAENFILRFRVVPGPGAACFGVRWRAGPRMNGGVELRFEPQRQKAGLRDGNLNSVEEAEHTALYHVEGLDKPFTVEMLVKGPLIDVSVDGRRTMVGNIPCRSGDGLYLFAQDSAVTISDIELRPLE